MNSKHEKEFLDVFRSMCYTRNAWEVWADFISAAACAIANSVDRKGNVHDARETEYAKCIERLGGVEKSAKLLSIIVVALEDNPEQDFLGKLYMNLELGNHWKGQFFTPYNICRVMSDLSFEHVEEEVKQKGWVSISDPACGAGATLVAAANILKDRGVNYQNSALFVAQDIDRVAGLMCYIQLSLLGCAGYVVIGDTLSNPISGDSALFPCAKSEQEIWYTPMFAADIWTQRRILNRMDMLFERSINDEQKRNA